MRKFIIGLIIGIIIATTISVNATKLATPPTFYDLANPNELTSLNILLEEINSILNGRYQFNVESSIRTSGSEGDSYIYSSGATQRLYNYVNGSWRYCDYDN